MDPITAIGLLGSLANLIQASNEVAKLTRSFIEGDREIKELLNDVTVFQEALKGFDRVLRSRHTRHNISEVVITTAIEETTVTFEDLRDRLKDMSQYETSAVRRMRWVQKRSTLMKLQERLKGQSAILQSFLALAHTCVITDCRTASPP